MENSRIITETFDPSNPLHWAKWQQAGRPTDPAWEPQILQTQERKGARWQDELPPAVVTTWEAYDANNADHVRRAALNKIADPVGTGWQPTLTYHLVGNAYVLQEAPEPPSASRDRFADAVKWAQERILDLKGAAKDAQVAAGVSEQTATTNGVLLFAEDDEVFSAIGKYEQGGGHPVVASLLLSKIKAKDLDWLKLPGVLAVFEQYLG